MRGDRVALALVLLGSIDGVGFSNTVVPLILFSLSRFFFAKNNSIFVTSTTFGLVFRGWPGFLHELVFFSGLAFVSISSLGLNGWFCSCLVSGSTINFTDVSWFLLWTRIGGFNVIFNGLLSTSCCIASLVSGSLFLLVFSFNMLVIFV